MEQLTAAPASADDLKRWCLLANLAAYEACQCRNTCIATSHALAAFLREKGLAAEPFRAEVFIWSDDRAVHGTSLGSSGDGTRRPAARPGMWYGHLAVACGNYILDPTIDQAEVGGVRIQPAVFAKPDGWDSGAVHYWDESDLHVRYNRYHRQVGWKSAGDARPSHWRDIAELMQAVSA